MLQPPCTVTLPAVALLVGHGKWMRSLDQKIVVHPSVLEVMRDG